MHKKGIIITVISLGVVGIGIFAGIKAYQNYQSVNTTAEVQYVSDLSSYYYGEETSSSGMVTNDQSQDVYALDEKTISEVHVEEGQTVSVGDPLISYDMTMSNLELEMKELDVSTINSRLEGAKKQLERLKNTTPIAPRPEEPDIPEPEPEPEPEFAYLNVMERIVEDKIIYFMRQFDVCTCARCKADTVALTMNGLMPKYIVTTPAAVDPLLSYYTNRLISDVTVEATKACMTIKENPRH